MAKGEQTLKTEQRRFVKMFQARFAPGMLAGTKTTTIRPLPTRPRDMPKSGDLLDARRWSGRPYNSPQMKIMEAEIDMVMLIEILVHGIVVGPRHKPGTMQPVSIEVVPLQAMDRMAKADGFVGWTDMLQWFRETHQLPFTGILIGWDPEKMKVA
jgi:hypothetical protein